VKVVVVVLMVVCNSVHITIEFSSFVKAFAFRDFAVCTNAGAAVC